MATYPYAPYPNSDGKPLSQQGLPIRKVTGRSIDWRSIVALAEGDQYTARVKYPVYQFGGGTARRIFTEDV